MSVPYADFVAELKTISFRQHKTPLQILAKRGMSGHTLREGKKCGSVPDDCMAKLLNGQKEELHSAETSIDVKNIPDTAFKIAAIRIIVGLQPSINQDNELNRSRIQSILCVLRSRRIEDIKTVAELLSGDL